MAVKAKDLAHRLGVSEATFSLVVNGKPGISDKTRNRVIQQLKDLGYDYLLSDALPDPVSPVSDNSFSEESNRSIGFVLYKRDGALLGMNSFFPLILDGLEATAREYGYSLTVISIECSKVQEQTRYLLEAGCVGYVIFATEMQEEDLIYFEQLGLPFIILDNYFISKNINSVKVDNRQGTFRLVEHLYQKGHRKIGYLGSGLFIRSFQERRESAFDALRSFGISNPDRYYYPIGYPHENADAGMTELLKKTPLNELPTAFLADNDLVAVGGMLAAKRMGYKVPDDLAFVGFDDRPICTFTDPALTTLQLPRGRFGAEAVHQLIRLIQGNESSILRIEVSGKLILRSSS